ncbi:MAG: tautomerase family protein [Deltaproteobacteria bacterium]|nr:tautomerase family protein [Deltaproteobacteria bacterium]
MPHVIIKLYPGRTEDVKKNLAQAIVKNVAEIANCDERAVSVAIEEVDPKDWAEKVYEPDILGCKDKLVVEPGYNP